MFDFIRNHTRILFFGLLVLIIPSFVFFGVQGYEGMGAEGGVALAKVSGRNITQAEFDAAHRDQVERVRRQMPDVDAKFLDSAEAKQQTLETMVRDRVMLVASDKMNLTTTDERLRRLFTTDPQFSFIRNPDGSLNKDLLAAQGMSSETFAQRLRQDLSARQVMQGISDSVFAPAGVAASALDALFQQREVQLVAFDARNYAAKVTPSEAEIEAFYKNPANATRFQAAEQATIEYLVMDVGSVKAGVSVSEDDLNKYYTENAARYTSPEERRASHILIKADKSAPADERAKAKAKAESLLAQATKNPAAFADLARKNSDDSGSAERGGDLDFFGRGAMVKPFEDAAFALKPGELSGLVESDFGFHVIRLATVRGGEKRAFAAVRAEIEEEIRQQLAMKKFAEAAVDFTNLVYEQSDSLKPAAEKFRLELRTATGVTRTPAPGASGPVANPKFLEALFGAEALRNKRNTDAIDIGSSQLVAGRVVQYAPARLLPLPEVRDKVMASVVAQQAAALARKEGEARLAALKAAPATAITESAQVVSRAQPGNLPRSVLDAVLREPVTTLPVLVGIDLAEQGYAVAKITRVLGRDPVAADIGRGQTQYAQAWADAESQAYYSALKSRYKAEVIAKPAGSAASDAAR